MGRTMNPLSPTVRPDALRKPAAHELTRANGEFQDAHATDSRPHAGAANPDPSRERLVHQSSKAPARVG
jgi:hypothetical protein